MADIGSGLWQQIIQQVVASGGNIIRPWFTQLEFLNIEHGLLEILVPGRRQQEYCRKHAARLFTEAAQSATGRLVSVCFLTAAEAKQDEPGELEKNSHTAEQDYSLTENVPLNDEYVFDAFVTGPCNRLGHAASLAISESPGKSYNPLFLYGNVGLGKTHLMQAACAKVYSDNPDASVVILSCETFVNHFIDAVEKGQLHEFRYRYRHADMLAIDDIQFLADHQQIQEEFFHTFNTLYQAQKQIVLTCDRGPGEIPGLQDRLVSRFNWGLVARIGQPCYETRVAIVHKKARIRGIKLPDDVVCFIAGTIDSNTRELEGAIAKVTMLATVADRAIDLTLAEEALGAERAITSREVTIEDILNTVTARYSVRLADLQSKKRSRSIAFPRQVCMFLARNLTRHSLEEIGGYFGGRDHTTVLHAQRAIATMAGGDPQFQATLETITQEIQAGSV